MREERQIRRALKSILNYLGLRRAEVDVFLLGDGRMKRLKRDFLPRDGGAANVLAFPEAVPFPHPEKKGKKMLGEVYLNRDILRRHPEQSLPLLVHGVLHLLGYVHDKKSDIIKMEKMENKILAHFQEKKHGLTLRNRT